MSNLLQNSSANLSLSQEGLKLGTVSCSRRKVVLQGCRLISAVTFFGFIKSSESHAQGIGWDAPSAQKVIRLCYNQVLERDVDSTGLGDFTDKMVNHNMSTQELVYGLGVSDEYKSRFINPWVPSQNWHPIVAKMYQHFLDRAPENEQVVVAHSTPLHEGKYDELIHTFVYGFEYDQRWGNLGVPKYGKQPVHS